MFTSDMAESRQKTVVLQGLDSGVFEEILSYIYSGSLHVSLDKVQPLYQAADLLQLDYVRDTCSSYMAMNVERSTCVDLYQFADVFYVDKVQKACLQLIHRHFVELASSDEFCSLSVNQLTEIISHDELDVKEETTVWEAVVRWVQHSREDRLHHLPSILPHIRFNLLTSDDMAAILDHPLVREDPGGSEVIRNVVQKGNPRLKPRLGMTTEMALLLNTDEELDGFLFMNPQEGKYISCGYGTNFPPRISTMTVTSDNDIYIISTDDTLWYENKLSLFKYNHGENTWENAGMASLSVLIRPGDDLRIYEEHLVEVDRVLYYIVADQVVSSSLMRMSKYNQSLDQWQECSQLQLDRPVDDSTAVSCGSRLYFLTITEVHRYDPSQNLWCKRTPPWDIHEVSTAVAMGTEIFCTDFYLTQTMVYSTESDCWQKLQGWPKPQNTYIEYVPKLFVLENQLHILITCTSDSQEGFIYFVCVYDRSSDAWTDLKATLPNMSYFAHGCHCPVARIYLPYLKGA
ncbi:kelch repeat and BTB domain-containing protein 8-like [Branchiostoma floridae]|uniref:Kelch repeat and BTB domain-containing protein 8-like n=1 Tax=Branchiostoma floridae TaxID=7739 RepID=A0A9J7LSW2_BRAFL|nr:kelch repeat and BTB domain-containing protein 8-like [Branchiostoma floridae]